MNEATVLDALVAALGKGARAYNPNDAAAPAVLLWTDKEREWEPLLPLLRERAPLLVLGPYAPEARTGPAYWLRCVIDGSLAVDAISGDVTPILYLPGVSRTDLRAVESCPEALQPLAELQYRGLFWSQKSSRDWTVSAFLQNADAGLALPVDGGNATREALKLALRTLAVTPVAHLREPRVIDDAFLHELVDPDPVSRLLRWLNNPAAEQVAMPPEVWSSFSQRLRKEYGVDPDKDGPITAARKLGERMGKWQLVWQRFSEAATSYPGISDLLRQASPPHTRSMLEASLPWPGSDDPLSSWPGVNQGLETGVRDELAQLRQASQEEARDAIVELERMHGPRRDWLWARLGQAPLARALQPLARLADAGTQPLLGMSVNELAASYANTGWQVDAAAIEALLAVREASTLDQQAVKGAVDALYRPWLAQLALRFQELAGVEGSYQTPPPPRAEPGTCLLFCDGLRFDLGQRLGAAVAKQGLTSDIGFRLAALPTLTPTAKPAVMPIETTLEPGTAFDIRAGGAQGSLTAESARKLLEAAGYQALRDEELGDPSGRGWTEMGQIDSYGHGNGWKVAFHAVDEIDDLAERIAALIAWGWQRVVVVTDHGWLMLPEALPKAELPGSLAEPRKDRCARIKPGSSVDLPVMPWHWDTSVRVAMAPGISSFQAGVQYAHGGLSPQECVTPVIAVSAGAAPAGVAIAKAIWRGLRCNVTLLNATPEMTIDLRTQAANASSSIALLPKHPDPDGTAAIFADDEMSGAEALVVVLSGDGAVLAQQTTTIGG